MTQCLNKILIVDDSELLFRMYALMFMRKRPTGLDLLQARSPGEASALLENHPDVDLILMDPVLGSENGMAFLREVLRNPMHRRIPVIIVSSEKDRDAKLKTLRLGAKAYVQKPFQPATLLQAINDVLDRESRNATGAQASLRRSPHPWPPASGNPTALSSCAGAGAPVPAPAVSGHRCVSQETRSSPDISPVFHRGESR